MNAQFEVNGIAVVLHPLDMVSVALDQLGEQTASLADHGQAIADALDELLTRYTLTKLAEPTPNPLALAAQA